MSRGIPHQVIYDGLKGRFLDTGRLEYRVASDSWQLEGTAASAGELRRHIAFELDAATQKVENTLTKVAFEARVRAERQMVAWLQSVEARPQSDAGLDAWLRHMEHRDTTPMMHLANISAMKQWIWQVKRGIAGRSVVHHVAPIFWSPAQGTGKSWNIGRLLTPFAAFTRTLDVDELGEKFSGRLFARTLVAFLDEFSGAENADANQLKAILAGKPIDARSMHAESGFFAANRMSCIATSNLEPPHGFVDHTGARRFWSIQVAGDKMENTPERARWLDAFDIDELWCAISVNDQSPQYSTPKPVLDYMEAEREAKLRTKTSLENFAQECLTPKDEGRIPIKEFQQAYRQYCTDTRQKLVPGGYASTSDKLTKMGYKVVANSRYLFLRHVELVDIESLRGEEPPLRLVRSTPKG